MGDVLKAAAEAAWKTDAGFQTIAKYLYGDDVVLEDVLDDIAKMDPASADVHVPGAGCKCAKCKKVEKFDRGQARDHHSGKFISTGQHVLRTAGEVAAAGVLGGVAATAGVKAPGMAAEAARGARAAFHGVEHASTATKDAAKVAGVAGGGMVSGVAAQENAQAAHKDIKSLLQRKKKNDENVLKILGEAVAKNLISPEKAYEVAKDWSKWNAERKEKRGLNQKVMADYYSRGGRQKYTHDSEYQSHARRGAAGALGAEAGVVGGLYSMGLASVHASEANRLAHNQRFYTEQRRHHTARAQEAIEDHGAPTHENAAKHPGFRFAEDAMEHDKMASQAGEAARAAARSSMRLGAAGAVGLAAGGALGGYAVHHGKEQNARAREIYQSKKKPKLEEKAARYDEHEVTWEGEFSKIDDEKKQVFGWASVTEIDGKPVVDLQGDYIHPTEMERAAYDYVLKSRVGGDMHARVDADGNKIEKNDKALHVSDMIESMVFTPEKVEKLGLPEGSLPTGWWVGFKVNDDEVWKSVKDGGRKGFSIHGLGARMEKRLDEIGKSAVDTLIEKAFEYADDYEEFADNLNAIYDRTGVEIFKFVSDTLHPQHRQQIDAASMGGNNKTVMGSAVGGSVGANIGTLAGLATGKEKGAQVGGAAGGLVGGATGALIGHKMPQRPPSLAHIPPPATTPLKPLQKSIGDHPKAVMATGGAVSGALLGSTVAGPLAGAAGAAAGGTAGYLKGNKIASNPAWRKARAARNTDHAAARVTTAKAVSADDYFEKSVGTQNRSGSTGQRQEAYTNHYLQQATQMMAPQVAQHIQQLQQQQMMQQMMEQQMLQNAPQQQNWQTLSQMGPQSQGPRPAQPGPQGPSGPVSYQQ